MYERLCYGSCESRTTAWVSCTSGTPAWRGLYQELLEDSVFSVTTTVSCSVSANAVWFCTVSECTVKYFLSEATLWTCFEPEITAQIIFVLRTTQWFCFASGTTVWLCCVSVNTALYHKLLHGVEHCACISSRNLCLSRFYAAFVCVCFLLGRTFFFPLWVSAKCAPVYPLVRQLWWTPRISSFLGDFASGRIYAELIHIPPSFILLRNSVVSRGPKPLTR